MSKDRTTEMLNYLSAISREVGEFRQETKAHFDKVDTRLDKIEGRLDKVEGHLDKVEARLGGVEGELVEIKREQRQTTQRLDRIHGLLLVNRSEIGELQDRVDALEGKQP